MKEEDKRMQSGNEDMKVCEIPPLPQKLKDRRKKLKTPKDGKTSLLMDQKNQ